ncbi:MAG: hypothetical protein RR293_02610 [Bacteroidales bacterium]
MGKILVILALMMLSNMTASSACFTSEDSDTIELPTATDRIDIFTSNGCIYINTTKTIIVKIYSILGNLVIEKKISAGTSQIQLKSRGIYLVNTGERIQRVTL